MSIIYALISRKTSVLVEYSIPGYQGNYRQTCQTLLLTKIEANDEKKSLMTDAFGFHYLVKDGLIILCMAELECDRNVCFKFNREVMGIFLDKFGDRWRNAIAYSLNNDFESVLEKKLAKANSKPDGKIGEIRSTLDDTKYTMIENIENLLERGEKLDVLVEKADELKDTAMTFQNKSKILRNQMWWKNCKYTFAVAFIVLILIYIIICVTCSPTFDC